MNTAHPATRSGKEAVEAPGGAGVARTAFATGPALAVAAALAVVLTATSGRYGYHRDELYFRMLPLRWGYVDQPPLAPLLARATRAVSDTVVGTRVPATLAAVLSLVVLVALARELGGGRTAQAICAWGWASASLLLAFGHLLLTSTVDLVTWPALTLCIVRARLRRAPTWWLAAGAVAGLATWDKWLVLTFVAALVGGVLTVGPRRLLSAPPVLAAAGVGVVLAAPNIVFQLTHGLPQLAMGAALARSNSGDVRRSMWWFLALELGPPLVPVWIAGLLSLARNPRLRPVRFLAAAFPVLLALVFLMGSQNYYPLGMLAVLFAAGCEPTARWLRRGPARGRRALLGTAVGLNAAVSAVIGLPLLPVTDLGPVTAVNGAVGDTVGWPTYTAQVAGVWDGLSRQDRDRAVVLTSNYGEAGAVDRYGPALGLPTPYSGHNALWDLRRPSAAATLAVVVGGQVPLAQGLFATCRPAGRLDNRVGVDNEEQGQPIAVCRDPVGGWERVWPALRHLD